jgi:Cu+-exporting ATPase
MGGAVAVYFEAAAVITVLVLLGQVLELRAREQTGGAIRALLDLAPKTARRLPRRRQRKKMSPLDQVTVGDRLRVRPGEGIPVDGVVLEGSSASTSRWSPASPMPVDQGGGDKVIGGTVNGTGALVMRAEKVGATRAGAHRRHGRRGAAQPRADPALADTVSPAGSCRR